MIVSAGKVEAKSYCSSTQKVNGSDWNGRYCTKMIAEFSSTRTDPIIDITTLGCTDYWYQRHHHHMQ